MLLPAALLLVVVLLPGGPRTTAGGDGVCPRQCSCNATGPATSCAAANLSVIPLFLNPAIVGLDLACNRLHKLEDGLAFYPRLRYL